MKIPERKYRLRWKFVYTNRVKVGVWDLASANVGDKSSAQSRQDLVRIVLEGEDRMTFKIRTLFECSAEDFTAIRGEAYSKVPLGSLAHPVKAVSNLYGISVHTQKEKVTVLVNGSIERRLLTEAEKAGNL
jgi:hypothetical protein